MTIRPARMEAIASSMEAKGLDERLPLAILIGRFNA
jgi:hypothetical protein